MGDRETEGQILRDRERERFLRKCFAMEEGQSENNNVEARHYAKD